MTLVKDPQAVLDYNIDWNDWLIGNDTITASTWTVSAGITLVSGTGNSNGVTTAWISGGTAGKTYTAVNHIITAAGREDDRTITLLVEDK